MATAMTTGRERIDAVLSGRVPDRVPLDIGGINNSTMHWRVEKALCEALGYRYEQSEIRARDQQAVIPDERILQHFDCDTRCLYLHEAAEWVERDGVYFDQWGIGRVNDGQYYTMRAHPLAGASLREALDAYEWPDPRSDRRTEGLVERARSYGGQYCLILEGLREISFGLPSWMRGMTEFYMDLAADPLAAHEFLDRLLEWNLAVLNHALDRLSPYLDIVKFADDLGSQSSLIISPEMYREFVKPRHAAIIQAIKARGHRVLLHTCGAVHPLIEDFIEIGIDALNPVQISAAGMDPRTLKERFGGRITFWGGGIDTQEVLPHATPAQVRAEVRKNMDAFREGGGYVFSQVHNIQPDVPVANVIAMYEAYAEFARYE